MVGPFMIFEWPKSVEPVVVVVAGDPVVVDIWHSSSDGGDLGPIKLVQITSPSLSKSHVLLLSVKTKWEHTLTSEQNTWKHVSKLKIY